MDNAVRAVTLALCKLRDDHELCDDDGKDLELSASAVEALATAAVSAAAASLNIFPSSSPAPPPVAAPSVAQPAASSLSAQREHERMLIHQLVTARPKLVAAMDRVGAYFNANNVMEHTCTTSTLNALNNALRRGVWLKRPAEGEVRRHQPAGEDSRGINTFWRVDGTQPCETSFGEIEKPICANGGYSMKVYHGKLMAKVRVGLG